MDEIEVRSGLGYSAARQRTESLAIATGAKIDGGRCQDAPTENGPFEK